jgi:hypothetical protein
MTAKFGSKNTVEALFSVVAIFALRTALCGQTPTSLAVLASAADSAAGSVPANHVVSHKSGLRLLFTPSCDDATSVISYHLDIFVAGADPDRATPVASKNLGKPPIVNGDMSVKLGELLAALPTGSYFVTATAIGPGGSARSAPSDTVKW